jgi:hypothetical protein
MGNGPPKKWPFIASKTRSIAHNDRAGPRRSAALKRHRRDSPGITPPARAGFSSPKKEKIGAA